MAVFSFLESAEAAAASEDAEAEEAGPERLPPAAAKGKPTEGVSPPTTTNAVAAKTSCESHFTLRPSNSKINFCEAFSRTESDRTTAAGDCI